MKLIEQLAREYYLERPAGFGNPTDDFEAGFRKAYEIIRQRIGTEIGEPGAENAASLKTIGFPLDLLEELTPGEGIEPPTSG